LVLVVPKIPQIRSRSRLCVRHGTLRARLNPLDWFEWIKAEAAAVVDAAYG
jgi:hypothetical protein